MHKVLSVILAAGEGKRMKSKKSKVVHEICGKPLIGWVAQQAALAGIEKQIVIIGHRWEQVKAALGESYTYVMQREQLGTGHAMMQAHALLAEQEGTVFVLYGDTPLIRAETLEATLANHWREKNAATVISADVSEPQGYGRILRNASGEFQKIVECKDADAVQKQIKEVNSGMYCFNIPDLLSALKELKNDNAQGEYYLTDTLEILLNKGLKVGAYRLPNSEEILGINDRVQLSLASKIIKERILTKHMQNGVTMLDPDSTYIEDGVEIGMDTVLHPMTSLKGKTIVGDDCVLGPNVELKDATIAHAVHIQQSVVLESRVDSGTHIGPFAYVRPGSTIGKNVKIGDFVEVKKSEIGDNTKISHLTYVGDACVGKHVNLGCGVVVVNYDGVQKHQTTVGDHAFIGCNVNLVSPVSVGTGAYVAAGSTITENVPADALAIARCKQTVKVDWVKNKFGKRG